MSMLLKQEVRSPTPRDLESARRRGAHCAHDVYSCLALRSGRLRVRVRASAAPLEEHQEGSREGPVGEEVSAPGE